MFFSPLLLDVLAGRGIEDIDAFLRTPNWNDLPDPMSIPSMEHAVEHVLRAVRDGDPPADDAYRLRLFIVRAVET